MPTKKQSKKSRKCPPGQIKRVSHTKTYKKTSKRVRIPPTCVKDMGQPGSGPKILPKIKSENLLRNMGYSLSLPLNARHAIIKKAVKKYGRNVVVWHLNYIRNITAIEKNRIKFTEDIVYTQRLAS